MIGRTVKTLQRWDRDGTLVAHRTEGNRRFYTHDQYLQVKFRDHRSAGKGAVVGYCRVFNSERRHLYDYQHRVILEYAIENNISVDHWLYDTGGLLNERKEYTKLYQMVVAGDVSLLIVPIQDRLMRYGYEAFTFLCGLHGTTVICVSDYRPVNEHLISPPDEETDELLQLLTFYRRVNKQKVIEKINEMP
ncbi:putative resolvase [Paenibacillus sp. V4I7]|nr:putative resolvase [Paenibacillus sp. V4I7]MDQ0913968.1 putative resolvase [Paenibacillus sp. V4I5]